MRIEIEADKCCGAGQCVMFAPTYFDMDDAGVAFALVDEADPADVVAQVLAALREGRDEVLADETSRQLKAALRREPGSYLQIGRAHV